MIITDKFVMINFPKTGSTFVRNVLKKIHTNYTFYKKIFFKFGIRKKPYYKRLLLPSIRNTDSRTIIKDEHGICSQIPKEFRNRLIVSVYRDIFERYISIYEYGNWKKSPWIDKEILINENKNFPNITFEEFVKLWTKCNPLEYHSKINKKLPIGPLTSQFILFFFKNPFIVLNEIDEKYINSKQYKKDIENIYFLRQKSLNKDLYNFLKNQNYSKNKINFILKEAKHNVSTPKGKSTNDYFTEELISFIKTKEYFLITIINDLGLK